MAHRVQEYDPLTLASIASHLADSLYRFVDELPDFGRDVRGIISTLFEIKTLLRELDMQVRDHRFNRLNRELVDDIVLCVSGCSFSIKDLDGIVLRCSMTRKGSSSRSAKKSWNEILSSFRNIEGSSLQARLDIHRTFLFGLVGLLRSLYAARTSKKSEYNVEVSRLQEQIRTLASQQEKNTARMREVEENHRRTVQEQVYQHQFQHHQPHHSRYPTPAPVATPPYESPPRRPYSTPLPSPPFSVPIDSYRYIPPPAPSQQTIYESQPMTPISPISPITPLTTPPMISRRFTSTPGTTVNREATPPSTPPTARPKARISHLQAPASKDTSVQWWSHVFAISPGFTSLSDPPRQSQCHGAHMENLTMAPDEHEIFRVEFDNDIMLRMFRNEGTEEAKVVCTKGGNGGGSWSSGRRNGYRFQTCINASYLTISRVGPGIQLIRRNLVWASLYFADFETLTLFYHAFLALRYNAPSAPVPKESEYWLDGESLMFSAKIDDGGHTHVLRLLKDNDSGCIRLAAAKADGMQDITMWTAFVTSQISSSWMYYNRPNCVIVKNIRQFSFSSCFETKVLRDFELQFLIAADALAFTQIVSHESRKMATLRNMEYRPAVAGKQRDSYF